MRYQLLTPWPVGQFCIDAGLTVDLNKPPQFWTDAERLAEGRIMPPYAICMDLQAVEMWKRAYGRTANGFHLKAKLEWFEEEPWHSRGVGRQILADAGFDVGEAEELRLVWDQDNLCGHQRSTQTEKGK